MKEKIIGAEVDKMQAYIKKFPKGSYEANELLRITAEKGRMVGMVHAGIRGYIAFCGLLEALTGNPNFGINPTNPDRVELDCEILSAKAHRALNQLISALDSIADGERRKYEAERELRLQLWRYMQAKKRKLEPGISVALNAID